MKILVIGLSDKIGGVENFIRNFVSRIEDDDVKFEFLVTVKKASFEEELSNTHKFYHILLSRKKHPLKIKKEIMKIYCENNFDAIWLNDCSLNQFFFIKYAKEAGISCRIVHSHNSYFMDYGKYRYIRLAIHKLNRLFVRKYATDFWACSNEAARFFFLKKEIKSKNFKIIKNAIDTKRFLFNEKSREKIRKQLNLEDKHVYIQVGRLHKQKNPMFSIEIFNEILKKDENAIMIFVGTGELKETLLKRTKELKMEKYVYFLGVRDDINDLISASDVFMLPSLYEGLPIVLIEAQCSGIPCAISDNITKECNINNDINAFINLNDRENWINTVMNMVKKEIKRDSYREKVIEAGFEITNECNLVKKFFLKINRRKNEKSC